MPTKKTPKVVYKVTGVISLIFATLFLFSSSDPVGERLVLTVVGFLGFWLVLSAVVEFFFVLTRNFNSTSDDRGVSPGRKIAQLTFLLVGGVALFDYIFLGSQFVITPILGLIADILS